MFKRTSEIKELLVIFITVLLLLFLISYKSNAQNVGIGTTNPQSTLDVRGNQRFGGINNFISYDTTSGNITWSNSHLFLPNNQQLIQHSASAEGLFYNNSQLEYRNQLGNQVFYTNWSNGNGYFSGNLGIGVSPAFAPLAFPAVLGKKITLYRSSGDAGFGVFGNELRISSDYNNADITFGYDNIISGFTERMRVKANGNVGIGTNSPGFPLNFASILGDKVAFWGNSGFHYGIGIQNSLLQIYTDGAVSDIAFGYGTSASFTEKFRLKGNGGMIINGSEGQNGQLLRSNGAGQPVSWANPLNQLYNNMTEYAQVGSTTVNPLTNTNIPGMSSIVLNIGTRSKVIFSSSMEIISNPCFACGGSDARMVIQVNYPGGSAQDGGTAESNIASGERHTLVTGDKIKTLDPGSYTIHAILTNENLSGPTITGSFGRLIIIIIPE
jgi:hypothetical protein